MTTTLMRCTHGLVWLTCAECSQKSEEQVKSEIDLIVEEQRQKLKFDYQDPNEGSDSDEQDLDYDLEDMRMS